MKQKIDQNLSSDSIPPKKSKLAQINSPSNAHNKTGIDQSSMENALKKSYGNDYFDNSANHPIFEKSKNDSGEKLHQALNQPKAENYAPKKPKYNNVNLGMLYSPKSKKKSKQGSIFPFGINIISKSVQR